MSGLPIWSVGLALVAGVGLILLLLGLRGRRVGDHRHCRRCGFDLTGTPDAPLCNECGRDLAKPRATRLGHLQRRRVPMVLGSLLLAGVVLIAGYAAVDTFTSGGWRRLAPEWVLLRDLEGPNRRSADAAGVELLRRFNTEDLSDGATHRLIADTLDRQADATRRWNVNTWGQFMETARAREQIDDPTWGQFLANAKRPVLKVRPRIRRGDSLPARVWLEGWRGGPNMIFHGVVELEEATLAGHQLPTRDRPFFFEWQMDSGGGTSRHLDDDLDTSDFPLGEQTLTARGRLRFAEGEAESWAGKLDGDELSAIPFSVSANVTIDPADAPAKVSVVDPSLRPPLLAALAVSPVWRDENGNVRVRVSSDSTGPNLLCHWNVRVRVNGGEFVDFGNASYFHPNHSTSHELLADSEAERILTDAAVVDVLLEPDTKTAFQMVDLKPTWGESILFRDVPVLARPPARPIADSDAQAEAYPLPPTTRPAP